LNGLFSSWSLIYPETARTRNFGYDIYFVEDEWRAWAAGKEVPRDPDREFLALFRSFSEKIP
jgi:hypothetical protein